MLSTKITKITGIIKLYFMNQQTRILKMECCENNNISKTTITTQCAVQVILSCNMCNGSICNKGELLGFFFEIF